VDAEDDGREGMEEERQEDGREEARRGMSRKRSTAKRLQSVKSMNEWEQDVAARRRSQVEGDGAEEGRRGSSYSPKVAEGGRKSRSMEGGNLTWEQREEADSSLRRNSSVRRVRGSRQDGGGGAEAQGPAMVYGRSMNRSSRSMQADEPPEHAGDTGSKAKKPSRRRQRSVQRDMDGEGDDVNLEYMM
jgi:hypothetical protein